MIGLMPLAAWGASLWMTAEMKLAKELGRKPTENEVRAALGYPLVIGPASLPYLSMRESAGMEVAIEGTSYRLSISPGANGGAEVVLLAVEPCS